MDTRAERGAMIALVTAFALIVQTLLPSLAVARPLADPGMTVCTEMGLMPAPRAGDPTPATSPKGCDHCLCPAAAPVLPTVVDRPVGAVCYAEASPAIRPVLLAVAPGRGLAAPPPPSQGPPAPNA